MIFLDFLLLFFFLSHKNAVFHDFLCFCFILNFHNLSVFSVSWKICHPILESLNLYVGDVQLSISFINVNTLLKRITWHLLKHLKQT